MPSYSFKRAPGAVISDFKLVDGGDKYNLVRGSLSDSGNISVASVVNYSVASNIIAASTVWGNVSPTTYDTRKTDFISYLINSVPSEFIPDNQISYWTFDKKTFFAVTVEQPFIEIEGQVPPFSETVNYNPDTLEFNVIRNNNPNYVKALYNFLTSSPNIGEWFVEGYNEFRDAALTVLSNEQTDIELPPADLG